MFDCATFQGCFVDCADSTSPLLGKAQQRGPLLSLEQGFTGRTIWKGTSPQNTTRRVLDAKHLLHLVGSNFNIKFANIKKFKFNILKHLIIYRHLSDEFL